MEQKKLTTLMHKAKAAAKVVIAGALVTLSVGGCSNAELKKDTKPSNSKPINVLTTLNAEQTNGYSFDIEIPYDPNRKTTEYSINASLEKYKDIPGFVECLEEILKQCIYNDCTNAEANMHIRNALGLLDKSIANGKGGINPNIKKEEWMQGDWMLNDALWSTFVNQADLHPGIVEFQEPEQAQEPTQPEPAPTEPEPTSPPTEPKKPPMRGMSANEQNPNESAKLMKFFGNPSINKNGRTL